MRALDIVVAHPGPQDVIELGPAEADEEIEAFALDRADERFCECVCVGRPVRDLDHTSGLRLPDGIETGAEFGVGVADQKFWRDALFFAPHKRVAGLLGDPRRVRGIGRRAAEDAAAAEMDEHQRISRPRSAQRKHGLREKVARDHGFHVRPDEGCPRQGGLFLAPFWAWVDARLVQDALDGIGTSVEPQLFHLASDPLVTPEKVFRPDADNDVAQFLRQARPPHRLKGASITHLGEPTLVGRGLGHFHQPVNIMPALFSDAQQFGLLGRRQDYPLRRDAGPQDRDLGLQQSQLRVVPRHEELVQEDQKEGYGRIHLAGLHHGV